MVEGTPRCLGGEGNPPLAAAPRRSDLLGCAPPPLGPPIYSGGDGGLLTSCLWCLPLPLQHILLLHSAWRSPAGVLQLHHHHAVVLLLESSSSTSPPPLLDQEGGDFVRSIRVLNAEVLSVQHLVIGDSNHVEYDYIITLQASARDLQVVCRCKLSPLTRCLDELIDGSW